VLATIHLNHQFPLAADEVTKVGPYWCLSNKFMAINLPSAKMLPKFRLCIRLVDAKAS
jgi:hypothetical protein